ncbi:hypothetical protein [Pseudosulfitobacter koreensis]|uniref:DNA-binding protein n=1 Tax=Pseudosulfitobacter koreensis TaxID=2968472 RepID=A0ABT1Z2Z1_9RHOB|nr:hypothetical protein [Pseudosulfitobacter koreense]MCR8827473.1 hypothetical protein [Pseudosulfitobacter koreense]
MKNISKDPGSASAEELAKYWRLPSARAARELARKVGVRHFGGRYAWYSIWASEGLAPPPRSRWDELKLLHCTADDVAGILGESPRSARRRNLAKPDAGFPDPIPLRKKPMLWRRAQLRAWQAGLPVPHYKRVSTTPMLSPEASKARQQKPVCNSFDPWAAVRSAATGND